jgi:hypothetical protein
LRDSQSCSVSWADMANYTQHETWTFDGEKIEALVCTDLWWARTIYLSQSVRSVGA